MLARRAGRRACPHQLHHTTLPQSRLKGASRANDTYRQAAAGWPRLHVLYD